MEKTPKKTKKTWVCKYPCDKCNAAQRRVYIPGTCPHVTASDETLLARATAWGKKFEAAKRVRLTDRELGADILHKWIMDSLVEEGTSYIVVERVGAMVRLLQEGVAGTLSGWDDQEVAGDWMMRVNALVGESKP
jgi:hypothetical protein